MMSEFYCLLKENMINVNVYCDCQPLSQFNHKSKILLKHSTIVIPQAYIFFQMHIFSEFTNRFLHFTHMSGKKCGKGSNKADENKKGGNKK
jgi:hypothetical protein